MNKKFIGMSVGFMTIAAIASLSSNLTANDQTIGSKVLAVESVNKTQNLYTKLDKKVFVEKKNSEKTVKLSGLKTSRKIEKTNKKENNIKIAEKKEIKKAVESNQSSTQKTEVENIVVKTETKAQEEKPVEVYSSAVELPVAEQKEEVKQEQIEETKANEEVKVVEAQEEVKVEDDKVEEDKKEEVKQVRLSGWVTEVLNIRKEKEVNSEIVGSIEEGTQVSGIVDEGWVKIEINGVVGYISQSFVSSTAVVEPEEKPVEKVEKEKLEEKPVEKVEKEKPEEKPEVEDQKNNAENAIKDAIIRDNISIIEANGTLENLLAAARSLVGTNYVFGGTSPENGFDCSGFVYYLYQKYLGVTLDRVTTGQATNGFEVSRDSMQAGDLVLFQNSWSSVIDHVGLYLGDGTYVHAATEDRGVVIDSVEGNYFTDHLVSVRRIVN